MRVQPLHDRVLVRRVECDTTTKGGLIIPDTAQEKPTQGVVEAVGPGALSEKGERVAMAVAVGDRVLFGPWSGSEVVIDGEKMVLLKEQDIFGIVQQA